MRTTYPLCLDALHHQIYPHSEVLVVDNASMDRSGALLAQDYPEAQESKWVSDDY